MALPQTIAGYGGPYQDEGPVENPSTQISSALFNRALENNAQMTRTAFRAMVMFDTTSVAPPTTLAASAVTIRTLWGDAASFKPTVSKTAVGRYTITFSAAFTDGLGESETLGFINGFAVGRGSVVTDQPRARMLTLSANVATIATFDDAVPNTLADTVASTAFISVTAWIL